MFFASDNWAGVHPAVASALSDAAAGFDPAYGSGAWDKRVAEQFNTIFEREVAVFFVATGTAANSLALASVARPGGVVFASAEAHIYTDEAGGPEYLTGGSRVRAVPGSGGKIDPQGLAQALRSFEGASVHAGQPGSVSITQSTEIGTVYSLSEIAALADIAKARGLPMHMDGARFANGLVALGCTPAEMSWKCGVDMLSFGGTKNGCWCAEAVIIFDAERARELPFYRMRAGHLHSKSRFIAAQFEAYLAGGLWLDSARHANAMARDLAALFEQGGAARLAWRPDANEVFAIIGEDVAARLQAAGAKFYDWRPPHWLHDAVGPDEKLYRFVTSFATTPADVSALGALLNA